MTNLPGTITSPSNPRLKRLRHLASRGTVSGNGIALAESPHLLDEALRSGIAIERVFVSERKRAEIAARVPPHRGIPIHSVSNGLFGAISTTSRTQGVLALVKLPEWDPKTVLSGLTVVLDGMQDPGNAGAIARSAEAFGASGIVFLKGSAAPTNPKALRAAAGSLFRLPFLQNLDSRSFLQLASQHGRKVFAAEARGGIPLRDAGLTRDAAIVIGSESHGIDPLVLEAARPVAIPTMSVESLNAAAAAAVILYEFASGKGAS